MDELEKGVPCLSPTPKPIPRAMARTARDRQVDTSTILHFDDFLLFVGEGCSIGIDSFL